MLTTLSPLCGAFAALMLLAQGRAGPFPLAMALAATVVALGTQVQALAPAPRALGALAALLLAASVATGQLALALGYLLATCALAGYALQRLARRRSLLPLSLLCLDAGHLLLPIGAGWWLAATAGVRLLGFGEPVVTLTALHFHFAGLGALAVVGGAGVLANTDAPRWYAASALATLGAIPLTALGILTDPAVERASATLLAAGLLAAGAWLVLKAAPVAAGRNRAAGWLLRVSGASLGVSMTAALVFAWTGSGGDAGRYSQVLPLERMLALHGAVNAVAFVSVGLLALRLSRRSRS